MRLAIMGRWNATCGVSHHAEILGKELVKLGHKIVLFSPTLTSANKDWHHRHIDVVDEVWVHRVYEETDEYSYPLGGAIRSESILEENYDIFIVEAYNRFPINEFGEIIDEVKKKAPIVLVLHLGFIRDVEPLTDLKWDAITVFDKRFIKEVLKPLDKDIAKNTIIIPYPYAIINGVIAERPPFAEGKTLFITYGRQPPEEYIDYVRVLRKLQGKYDITYWVIRSDSKLPFKDRWIHQSLIRPDIMHLHKYVKGADIHLLPKGETKAVVISSTLNQMLYAGTPTVVPDTRYFEYIRVNDSGFGAVVKYRQGDTIDLSKKLIALIERDDLRSEVSEKAKKLALKYSDKVVAEKYIELFNKLLA